MLLWRRPSTETPAVRSTAAPTWSSYGAGDPMTHIWKVLHRWAWLKSGWTSGVPNIWFQWDIVWIPPGDQELFQQSSFVSLQQREECFYVKKNWTISWFHLRGIMFRSLTLSGNKTVWGGSLYPEKVVQEKLKQMESSRYMETELKQVANVRNNASWVEMLLKVTVSHDIRGCEGDVTCSQSPRWPWFLFVLKHIFSSGAH